MQNVPLHLREAVVCVQSSLASACGLGLQAVRRDHHEDEVRQGLLLPLVQVVQIQALVLLISIHTLIIHKIKTRVTRPFSAPSLVIAFNPSIQFTKTSLTLFLKPDEVYVYLRLQLSFRTCTTSKTNMQILRFNLAFLRTKGHVNTFHISANGCQQKCLCTQLTGHTTNQRNETCEVGGAELPKARP